MNLIVEQNFVKNIYSSSEKILRKAYINIIYQLLIAWEHYYPVYSYNLVFPEN